MNDEKKIDTSTLERLTAIAIKYNRDHDNAPKVIEKGNGLIAAKIIEIAERNRIPIHKDAYLAEILQQCELDAYIPLEAYSLVAKILAALYANPEHKSS